MWDFNGFCPEILALLHLNIYLFIIHISIYKAYIIPMRTKRSPSNDGTWDPDNWQSREEWLRCHGFPCETWEATRMKLQMLKMMTSKTSALMEVSESYVNIARIINFRDSILRLSLSLSLSLSVCVCVSVYVCVCVWVSVCDLNVLKYYTQSKIEWILITTTTFCITSLF